MRVLALVPSLFDTSPGQRFRLEQWEPLLHSGEWKLSTRLSKMRNCMLFSTNPAECNRNCGWSVVRFGGARPCSDRYGKVFLGGPENQRWIARDCMEWQLQHHPTSGYVAPRPATSGKARAVSTSRHWHFKLRARRCGSRGAALALRN